MAAQPLRSDANVRLRDEADYRGWLNQLQSLCMAHNVWPQVDPDSTTVPLTKPTSPEMPNIAEYTPTQGWPADRVPARLSELSNTGQRAYKEDLDIYKLQIEDFKIKHSDYKAEASSLRQIVIFIQNTVSPHLQRTCCLPGQTLKEWITQLKAKVGITPTFERELARKRYHDALKPLRTVNNWDTWLVEYDHASSDAETLSVPELLQFDAVAVDFIAAVNKIAPMWAATFLANGKDQPGMDRKDMMRRFREYMLLNHPITRKSQKAAFVVDDSAFLTESSQAAQGMQGDPQHAETGNSRGTKRGRPRYQRTAMEDGDNPPHSATIPQRGRGNPAKAGAYGSSAKADANKSERCPGCDMRHSIRDCYYVYPGKAPEWWEPNPRTAEFVALKKQHDSDFQGLLRAQSRPRTKTPSMKNSHTPTPEIPEQ